MIHFDLDSPNQLLLNPRLAESEKQVLRELRSEFEKTYSSRGYFLVASSGSSQKAGQSAKLVALSVKSVLNSARRVNLWLGAESYDNWALVLPDFHVAGLGVRARAYLTGALVFGEDWMGQADVSFISMVPAQVHDLVAANVRAPSDLKKVFVGAGSLHADLREQFAALGWPVVETYGMTETCSMVAFKEAGEFFTLFPGVEARLEDIYLSLRCDSMLSASLQKEGDAIRQITFAENEWLSTRDIAELQPGGKLYFKGRDGEYVKILGEGVSVRELREVLQKIALSNKISPVKFELLAMTEQRAGHELVLVIEKDLDSRLVGDLLQQYHLQARPYEKIGRIEKMDSLPRTDLGKLKLEELKSIIKARGSDV